MRRMVTSSPAVREARAQEPVGARYQIDDALEGV